MADAPRKLDRDQIAAALRTMGALAVAQVDGSLPAGARVAKSGSEAGDGHADGTLGRVLGVLPVAIDDEFAYFVAWDDAPEVPVFTRGRRLRAVEEPQA